MYIKCVVDFYYLVSAIKGTIAPTLEDMEKDLGDLLSI